MADILNFDRDPLRKLRVWIIHYCEKTDKPVRIREDSVCCYCHKQIVFGRKEGE
jgi:hypothetical protein